MKQEWEDLGRQVGFVPVWDDIAVIECHSPQAVDRVFADIAAVMMRLTCRDIDDYTLVVAFTDLDSEITDAFCDTGAYLVVVPNDYWRQEPAERLKILRGLISEPKGIEHLLPNTTAAEMKLIDRVPGLYAGRNPDWSDDEIEQWRKRVFA